MTSWTLEVKEDPETKEQFIEFPDGVLEGLGWKEGDTIEWVDNKDGSWLIRKISPPQDGYEHTAAYYDTERNR